MGAESQVQPLNAARLTQGGLAVFGTGRGGVHWAGLSHTKETSKQASKQASKPTPRGHTPCVSRRGWRGAAPPLTPAFPARRGSGGRRGAPTPEPRRGGHGRA